MSFDSGPRVEVNVDTESRQVKLLMWKQYDLQPTPITFPFVMMKEIAGAILAHEAAAERERAKGPALVMP